MSLKKPLNPFYVVLVATGIAFCLTAACYMLLMLRLQRPDVAGAGSGGGGLLAFVDRYGNRLFVGELLILGVATVGAITTDRYWMRRQMAARSAAQPAAQSAAPPAGPMGDSAEPRDEGKTPV